MLIQYKDKKDKSKDKEKKIFAKSVPELIGKISSDLRLKGPCGGQYLDLFRTDNSTADLGYEGGYVMEAKDCDSGTDSESF